MKKPSNESPSKSKVVIVPLPPPPTDVAKSAPADPTVRSSTQMPESADKGETGKPSADKPADIQASAEKEVGY